MYHTTLNTQTNKSLAIILKWQQVAHFVVKSGYSVGADTSRKEQNTQVERRLVSPVQIKQTLKMSRILFGT